MRAIDEADRQAERLFDMVRDERPDQEVIDAIAQALRDAAKLVPMGFCNDPAHALGRV